MLNTTTIQGPDGFAQLGASLRRRLQEARDASDRAFDRAHEAESAGAGEDVLAVHAAEIEACEVAEDEATEELRDWEETARAMGRKA